MLELLTVAEVARLCRVHPITIRRHIAQGRLKSLRLGRSIRVRREDVESYIETTGTEAAEPEGGWKVLTPDSSFFKLVGIGRSSGPTDVSTNKHKYIADAIQASHD
jgi:excisionase family DNA binding protein